MEVIKSLLIRFRQSGVLLLIGFLLIIYIAFGFVYWQQGSQQRELEEQITKLSLVVAKPLPSAEKLRAEYDEVNQSLRPMSVEAALEIIVSIAKESRIDIDEDSGKFRIPPVPPATVGEQKVGESSYQVLSFKNISVQGDYSSVMAFISALDSGKRLKTMVLKRVATKQIEIKFTGEEGERRAEFRNVASAVLAMMTDNGITAIPNPINYAGGTGVNDMTAFPDSTSEWTGTPGGKTTDPDGNSYTVGDKAGYILYGHDIMGDGAQTGLVNYVTLTQTTYYYTCEKDGTVRQWDGPDVATATEYLDTEESKTETVATLDVDIYTKPEGESG